MCFDGGEPPDDALVRMLMEYVTGRRPQNANNEQPIRTKQINLFNDNLDPNPVIRSVLLQLLLRSRYGHFPVITVHTDQVSRFLFLWFPLLLKLLNKFIGSSRLPFPLRPCIFYL